jgi:tRNA pseudouridine55 synthase
VSAVKVAGRRAYQRVREGEDVELPPRRVTIHDLTVHEVRGDEVDISVRCSSGTYVRAIARDAGARLGVGGHLTALRRTAVGPFDLAHARTLDQLAEHLELLPIGEAARLVFPAYDLDEEQASDVRFGRRLRASLPAAGPVAVFAPDGEFLALYAQQGDLARAVAVFTG